MSRYKLAYIDTSFIVETIARTGIEQLLTKNNRPYVGIYDSVNNWYIPLRSNIGFKKPIGSYYLTPFETNNLHFVNPGLDFQKSLFVPSELQPRPPYITSKQLTQVRALTRTPSLADDLKAAQDAANKQQTQNPQASLKHTQKH